ncbi:MULTISPECIES: hypothetical protein [unclassified Aureimonas]|uniref:hypothetical protein n=1 Tax=unclassified Aureimonas TaxID=2615206 RepID=UPI0006F61F02|nr:MULTISPECIES: hypothetical protein [unclassified Aureimonas]KQT62086.1 hypothetical protein ASG62_23530 [Aureimonas sp. Leaf427]KQT72334.1 hypothetical protein ASG54_18520 [Aureimonas sp. Leaf460]
MSAHLIFDAAPLGALVRYFDGTSRPPARFAKKLAAWRQCNGIGRLTRKQPARERPTFVSPPSFTLHEGDFGDGSVIIVTVSRTFPLHSDLRFEIAEHPPLGAIRVLQEIGNDAELLHLAESREAAELWLARNRYSRARIEEVSADEAAADTIEGRRAA